MLDAFDIMLYSLVLASLMRDLNLTKAEGGALNSVTLVAARAGGLLFGGIADRYGRKRALMGSVLLYSIFTALCGLATNWWQLVVFRALPRHRHGRRVGERRGARRGNVARRHAQPRVRLHAELLGDRIRRRRGRHRLRPAGVGLARHVSSSACCRRSSRCGFGDRSKSRRCGGRDRTTAVPLTSRVAELFGSRYRSATIAITAMNACTLFAWWGLNTWVPAYLVLSPGGRRRRTQHRRHLRHRVHHADRDVARLRELRLHHRSGRPQARVRVVPDRRERAVADLRVRQESDGAAGARSAGGVLRHRIFQRVRSDDGRRSIRPRFAPPPRDSPTTPAGSPAPPPRSSSVRWRPRAASAWRSRWPDRRSCWRRCCGSRSRKHGTRSFR